jgi:hypothetical protein
MYAATVNGTCAVDLLPDVFVTVNGTCAVDLLPDVFVTVNGTCAVDLLPDVFVTAGAGRQASCCWLNLVGPSTSALAGSCRNSMGRAAQVQPYSLPNCVAKRRLSP